METELQKKVERIVVMSEDRKKAYLIRQEVIRCKDCKHYKPRVGWCQRKGLMNIEPVDKQDFCSKADRIS